MPHPGDGGGDLAFEAIADYFVGDSTMSEALQRICQAAVEAVPPAIHAGISMAHGEQDEALDSAARAQDDALTSLALRLSAGTHVVGTLHLYAPEGVAFSADDVAVATSFATRSAFVLLNHLAYWQARSLSENLQEALTSRAEIEQAKGIIMATTGVNADEAFEQLRQQSQHENVKVRELASEIVRRSQRSRGSA